MSIESLKTLVTMFGIWVCFASSNAFSIFAQENRVRLEHDEGGRVVAISYSGSADWLIEQSSERSHWHKYMNLERITISHTRVTAEMIDFVSQLESVTELVIGAGGFGPGETDVELSAYDSIANMRNLEYLELVEVLDGDGGREFHFLSSLENLRDVMIASSISDDTLRHISTQTHMESFWCWDFNSPSRESLLQFAELPNLRSIKVGTIEAEAELISEFIHSVCTRQLEKLDFSVSDDFTLSAEDLETICGQEELVRLGINRLPADSAGLIGQLKKLDSMDLSFEGALENFDFLGELPSLRLFYLNATGVQDSSLQCLRDHPTLSYIGMRRLLIVNDAHIDVFETMPNLRYVQATRCDISWAERQARIPHVRFDFPTQ